MTTKIKLVRGDTSPQIRLALTDSVNNQPINLTGGTVTLHFRAAETSTVLFSRPALINPETATTGVCFIQWEEGDLDVDAGYYEGEIEIVRSTGARETIYDMLKFRVRDDIA